MKILIADDQREQALALEKLVRAWGYEAVVVGDGLAALEELLRMDGPCLALLDWLMPGMDGVEVCRHLRREEGRPYAYLLLMTGKGGREPMVEGLEAGADDFLAKPADPAELKARLGTGRRIVGLQERLHEVATRDSLTGLWSRAAVLAALCREMARADRQGAPLAVALADVDWFKSVNDTFGHLAGDAVLREVARRMASAVRPYDSVGRYGGEEFLAVLPGCGAEGAAAIAERMRSAVAAVPIQAGAERLKVTVSIGVASCVGWAEPDALLRAADEALYHAKRGGRNRVEVGCGQSAVIG